MTAECTLTGPQQAAMVILAIDENLAAEVLRSLEEDDLRRLAKAVEALDPVPMDQIAPALEKFQEKLEQPTITRGGGAYIRRIAAQAFGQERADSLFAPPALKKGEAIEAIRTARTSTLADLLQEEHPQVAAVILSQLSREQAAKVLLHMREDRQSEMLERIANMEELPQRAMEVASQALLRALREAGALGAGEERSHFDGVSFAASLMNELPTDDNDRLLEELEDSVPDLAPKIREAMFTFEDLGQLDNRSMQTLMREIASEELLTALKTASETLREKFFGAVSSRAATTMRDDLDVMPPKRLSDVEEAQRGIVDSALRLAADGQLVLPGGAGEVLV